MNKKYIKCFALIMILVFPISCAKIVPTKKRKKTSRVIIRKPSKKEILKKPEPRKKKETKRAKKIITGLPAILPTYFNKKNGSDMAYLHGGNFIMGDNLGEKNERPAAKVYVPAFFIDIYEITNAQYKAFNNHFEGNPTSECNLCPVTGITWEEAKSYCKWAGNRLPTENEWEKTARGTQQLKWPWGNSSRKDVANILENEEFRSNAETPAGPVPVGSFPQGASVFGVFDLTGNVWEWTNSLYLPYINSLDLDIRYQKQYRVLRGGSWKNILENSRTTFRHPISPDTKLPNIGFRCARDADESTTHRIKP